MTEKKGTERRQKKSVTLGRTDPPRNLSSLKTQTALTRPLVGSQKRPLMADAWKWQWNKQPCEPHSPLWGALQPICSPNHLEGESQFAPLPQGSPKRLEAAERQKQQSEWHKGRLRSSTESGESKRGRGARRRAQSGGPTGASGLPSEEVEKSREMSRSGRLPPTSLRGGWGTIHNAHRATVMPTRQESELVQTTKNALCSGGRKGP